MSRILKIRDLGHLVSDALTKRVALKDMLPFVQTVLIEDWKKYSSQPKNGVERVLAYQDDMIEMKMLSWAPRGFVDVHRHSLKGCVFKNVSGIFQERFVIQSSPFGRYYRNLQKGDASYIDDTIGYHSVRNSSHDEYGYSLHIYSHPNDSVREHSFYREEENCLGECLVY